MRGWGRIGAPAGPALIIEVGGTLAECEDHSRLTGPVHARRWSRPDAALAYTVEGYDKWSRNLMALARAKDLYWDSGYTAGLEFYEMAAARFRN